MQAFFVEIGADRPLSKKEAFQLILEKARMEAENRKIKNYFIGNHYPSGGPFRRRFYWKARVVEVRIKIEEVI